MSRNRMNQDDAQASLNTSIESLQSKSDEPLVAQRQSAATLNTNALASPNSPSAAYTPFIGHQTLRSDEARTPSVSLHSAAAAASGAAPQSAHSKHRIDTSSFGGVAPGGSRRSSLLLNAPIASDPNSLSAGVAYSIDGPIDLLSLPSPSLLSAAKAAMLQNLIPGICLWILAVTIVVCYFAVKSFRPSYDKLGALKSEYGFAFSALAQCIAAAWVPSLFVFITESISNRKLRASGRTVPQRVPRFVYEVIWMSLFWCEKGIEVDLFYRLQAIMFGTESAAKVIIPKVLVDQFIYTPTFGTPLCVFAYMFKDCNFSCRAFVGQLDHHFWTFKLPSTVISGWCVWIPSVSLIYCLPPPLQTPLFNVVSCFWAILIITLSAKAAPTDASVQTQITRNQQQNSKMSQHQIDERRRSLVEVAQSPTINGESSSQQVSPHSIV